MEWSIEDGILKLREKLGVSERYAFLSALVVGFITHSFIFYNKISYADDSRYYFNLGNTYASGRWGLGVIEKVNNWLGLQSYSLSLANGVVSILLLAVFAMVVVHILNIKKSLDATLVGAYVVVFPAVASTFAYMFTAPYYFLAALLMALAVWMAYRSWWGMTPAALLISFGMGIYQAYFGLATALFVMKLINDAKNSSFIKNMVTAVRCLVSLVMGLGLYFVFNKFFLTITHTELGDYQGVSSMTSISLENLLTGIVGAYKSLPQLTKSDFVGIAHTELIRNMYSVCFIITVILAVAYLMLLYKKSNILNMLYGAVLFTLVPLSIGIIFVMTWSPDAYIHTLMIYSFVVIPIYPIMLLNALEDASIKAVFGNISVWIKNVAIIVFSIMILFYFRLDNSAYLKADYQQENAVAYFTTVLSEIKGTDGYSDLYPVAFLGNLDGMDWSIKTPLEFNEIKLQGYHTNMNEFISYFADVKFLEQHCGYAYTPPADMQKIYESEYIRNMPCYPDDGAIQVVDGVVIVKFSNTY